MWPCHQALQRHPQALKPFFNILGRLRGEIETQVIFALRAVREEAAAGGKFHALFSGQRQQIQRKLLFWQAQPDEQPALAFCAHQDGMGDMIHALPVFALSGPGEVVALIYICLRLLQCYT